MSKLNRAVHGPSWAEVILGAILSLILGVVVGVLLLVIKPVATVKELPKEPVSGLVYYVEGVRGDSNKAKQVMAKRRDLADGQAIKLTEDEVNAFIVVTSTPVAAAPQKGAQGKPEAAASSETVTTGMPNVRIRNGVMQVAVPVTINLWGVEQKVIAQARGGFEKQSDGFAFVPAEVYVGSCPIQRLPFLNTYVREKVLTPKSVPDEVRAAWSKLTNVSIEGNTLNLAM